MQFFSKNLLSFTSALIIVGTLNFFLSGPSGFSQSSHPTVRVDDINANEDTTITIQKGKPTGSQYSRYEILTEEDEIMGDPALGKKAAYQAWKTACSEWKKETEKLLREDSAPNEQTGAKSVNRGRDSKLLSIQCGSPTSERDPNGQLTYKSIGKYRMRVLKEEAQQ